MDKNPTMKNLLDALKVNLNSRREITGLGLAGSTKVYEPISISRRIIAAGALSSLFLGALGIRYSLPGHDEHSETVVHYDKRIYTDGDVIRTPIGEVKVDGWKFEFERENYLRILNEGIEFTFTAICNEGTKHGHFRGSPQQNPQISLDDLVQRPINPESTTLTLPMGNYYYFTALPHIDSNPVIRVNNMENTLKLAVYRQGSPKNQVHIYEYRVKNFVFPYPPEDRNDSVRVICERRIKRDYLQPIHRLQRLFSEYKDPSLFFILDENLKRNRGLPGQSTEFAESNRYTEVNYLTVDGFRMPFFPMQAEIGACHEIAHNILNSNTLLQYLGRMDAELKAKDMLEDAFNFMRDYDDAHRDLGIFSAIAESTYFGSSVYGIRSDAGHPRYEPSESFASTVCVLRYFGREFSEKYARLNPDEQSLVRSACNATIRIFLAMNPSQALLRKIFPGIDFISRRTGINIH